MGAAAGAARYMAVRVHVDVRVDGGGDVEAVDLPLPAHQEVACWTALQAECTISSGVLMVVLPDGAEREAGHRQMKRGPYTLTLIYD